MNSLQRHAQSNGYDSFTVKRLGTVERCDHALITEMLSKLDKDSVSIALDKLEEISTFPRPHFSDKATDLDWTALVAFFDRATMGEWPNQSFDPNTNICVGCNAVFIARSEGYESNAMNCHACSDSIETRRGILFGKSHLAIVVCEYFRQMAKARGRKDIVFTWKTVAASMMTSLNRLSSGLHGVSVTISSRRSMDRVAMAEIVVECASCGVDVPVLLANQYLDTALRCRQDCR